MKHLNNVLYFIFFPIISYRIYTYSIVIIFNRFHSKWLRFNCQCSLCVDSDTNQGRIEVEKLPLDLTLKDVNLSGTYSCYFGTCKPFVWYKRASSLSYGVNSIQLPIVPNYKKYLFWVFFCNLKNCTFYRFFILK